ncbi:hypothetical protein Droror1_Dr00003945 [Drosera rotundifolia]
MPSPLLTSHANSNLFPHPSFSSSQIQVHYSSLPPSSPMKKSGIAAASAAVAVSFSAARAVSSSSSNSSVCLATKSPCKPQQEDGSGNKRDDSSSKSVEKFKPRFDGLRFIETLVTAHR